MYFLETISGLSGENLTSAVFKYLLLNSSPFRSLFHKQLFKLFPTSRIPEFRNGVVCTTEEGTSGGRIDLLVDTDNCVIVIENKLWAPVQAGQPGKYAKFLKDEAAKRHGDADAGRIVVVLPEQRLEELAGHIAEQGLQGSCYCLTWESVLEDLQKVIRTDVGPNQAVAGFLHEYVHDSISRFDSLKVPTSLLVGSSARFDNSYQVDLLYRLRDFFPESGKIVPGQQHRGFYFAVEKDSERSHWLGFTSDSGESCLEIHTGPLIADAKWPPNVSIIGPSYAGGQRLKIAISEPMKTRKQWQELLYPIRDALQAATKVDSK